MYKSSTIFSRTMQIFYYVYLTCFVSLQILCWWKFSVFVKFPTKILWHLAMSRLHLYNIVHSDKIVFFLLKFEYNIDKVIIIKYKINSNSICFTLSGNCYLHLFWLSFTASLLLLLKAVIDWWNIRRKKNVSWEVEHLLFTNEPRNLIITFESNQYNLAVFVLSYTCAFYPYYKTIWNYSINQFNIISQICTKLHRYYCLFYYRC